MFGGVKKIESLVFGFTIGKIQAILPIFATRMKKLKYLATATAIVISLLLGFDDSISLFADLNNIEIPSQSDCSGVSHHHHQNLTDHFFQKSLVMMLIYILQVVPYSGVFNWVLPTKSTKCYLYLAE
jgi:hypothetical protein